MTSKYFAIGATVMGLLSAPVGAKIVDITITVKNLAPVNSVSFAPLRFGFHNGSFDAFDNGEAPGAAIISIAEGGSGADWFPAFAAADPTAVLGSTSGAQTPGTSQTTLTFRVNTALNPFFTFASMVVPSNDHFIGNDDAQEYRLFDLSGNLLLSQINQSASDIWDGGSEIVDPAAAAFLVGGTNALRTAQNGVVNFNFSELAQYNGLQTAAGYTFESNLFADTPIYEINFSVAAVPEPSTWAMLIIGFGLTGAAMRRRTRAVTA